MDHILTITKMDNPKQGFDLIVSETVKVDRFNSDSFWSYLNKLLESGFTVSLDGDRIIEVDSNNKLFRFGRSY